MKSVGLNGVTSESFKSMDEDCGRYLSVLINDF